MVSVRMNKGLPGCGKSTDAEKWRQIDPNNRILVCRDEIRTMLGVYWMPGKRERLVTEIEEYALVEAAKMGYSVTIDATNLRLNAPTRFKKLLDAAGIEYEFEIIDFTHVPIETCIERDALRVLDNCGKGSVGADVINKMAKSYDYGK